MTFQDYINQVRSRGQYSFTTTEAATELGITVNAVRTGMYKLKKKGSIVSPARQLYIIVPPEHQRWGTLPAAELVPLIMSHWNCSYYACCLTAADYHGASHQKPQIFQIMTNKRRKNIVINDMEIEFLYKKNLDPWLVDKRVVKSGYLYISSPELTAIDLLAYRHKSGGLNHIATVLSELVEAMSPKKLGEIINRSKPAYIQRLGYLLECVKEYEPDIVEKLLAPVVKFIKSHTIYWVPLAKELPTKGVERNKLWKLIINTTIEPDE